MNHPQFFAYQRTVVSRDIFDDNEKVVNDHPYYGDKSVYFPTLKLMNSHNFGPIEVNPGKKAKLL